MDLINDLPLYLKTMWYIAIPVSVIFLIQTVMTFAGIDSHDGTHSDFNSDLDDGDHSFQLFSFRNMMNFLLGFSWTGIAFYSYIENHTLLTILALSVGAGLVALFFFIMRSITGLAENNSIASAEALGLTASVYLTIPGQKSGKGKVQISIRQSTREMDAMTEGETIPTGSQVRVTEVLDKQLLLVNKL
jgi:hypothetical protein